MGARHIKWMLMLLVMAMLLAGCGGTEDVPTGAAEPIAPTATATRPVAAEPAGVDSEAPPTPTQVTGADAAGLPDVPYQMTGYEIIAARVGSATYSGYTCVLTPAGCACELPAIQQATFTFRRDGALEYAFERDDYADTWEMFRAGANEWEYRFRVESEGQGGAVGEGRLLLSFTEAGYVINQLVNFQESGIVTCPEVNFRRLPAGDE